MACLNDPNFHKFCMKNGIQNALIKEWERFYTKDIRDHPEKYFHGTDFDFIQEVSNNHKEIKSKLLWYIVINPDPKKIDGKIHEFVEDCLKSMQKVWIKSSTAWFEFRKKGDYNSIHFNLIISNTKYQLSRVKYEFGKTFKNWIGDDESHFNNYINIQNNYMTEYETIFAYRNDEKKKHDHKMRDKLKLKEYYEWDLNFHVNPNRCKLTYRKSKV